MYVVIVGCGEIGSAVARLLARDKHNIVVVDNDLKAFQHLGPTFNGITILGNGIDLDVQRKSGVEEADVFMALTGNDATNLMAAQVAGKMYHVPKVIARVADSENEALYKHFGIQTTSPARGEAAEIRNLIIDGPLYCYLSLERERLEMVRAKIKAKAVGKTVATISSSGQMAISLVFRDSRAFIPALDTTLQENDEVVVVLTLDHINKHRKWLEI
ncbi:MAG: hypothetical protein GX986_05970 [Firmicutes bacterium]|nr:hypothetical protein [Bacillota bacterium]